MRDLSLTLRPKFESAAADKAIAKQGAALRSTQTTMERLNKETAKGLKEQESLWKRLETATQRYGRTAAYSLGVAARSADVAFAGIGRMQRGFESAIKSMINIRSLIVGTAVGAGAYKLGSSVFSAGAGDVRSERALTREFGPGLLSRNVREYSGSIAKYAGREDNDVQQGLLPLARAIRETKIGDTVGGKRIRTKSQLEAVQNSQFKQAAERFKVLATLNKDMSAEQIGFMISEAGQGEEGLRALAGGLHLGRGSMADIKRDAHKAKMGIGDTVGMMFERSGHTGAAADIERKSFESQISALEATIQTSMGQIGSKAIDKLNERLGQGATLAERFNKFLTPERIDKFADAIAGVADKLATMAEKLPAAFNWLEEHKTTLLTVAGAYGALRLGGAAISAGKSAYGGIKDIGSGLSDAWKYILGKKSDKLAGVLGAGSVQAIPVYIVDGPMSTVPLKGVDAAGKGGKLLGALGKVAAVAGVGIAAYEGMTALDNATGGAISGGTAKAAGWVTGQGGRMKREEDAGVGANAARLASNAEGRAGRIAELERRGISHGEAVYAADNTTSAAGMATMKKAGINVGGITLNVGAAVGQNMAGVVKEMMPHLQEQLMRALMAQVPAK